MNKYILILVELAIAANYASTNKMFCCLCVYMYMFTSNNNNRFIRIVSTVKIFLKTKML